MDFYFSSSRIVGDELVMLHDELKHQRKLVKILKRKSLWSRNMEEVHDYRLIPWFPSNL